MAREQNRYRYSSGLYRSGNRGGWKKLGTFLLLLIPLLALLLWAGNLVVSRHIIVEERRLTVLNLPSDLEEYSILHLSDLHGARYGEKQKYLGSALSGMRYSCVVMTGDMLGEDGDVEPLLELLALMPRDTPKYLIPGDTDGPVVETRAHNSLSVYPDWVLRLRDAGVQVLERPVSETRGKGTIWFIPEDLYVRDRDGMRMVYRQQLKDLNKRAASLTPDDAARSRALEYELERLDALEESIKKIQPGDIQIVLTHTPLTSDYVSDMISWSSKEDTFSIRYASLILAGHYNGGQWRLPFGRALYVPELGWFPDDSLVQGLSYLEGIPQHISPGLGADPRYTYEPGRFYNSPTITRITLTRKTN